MSDPSPSTDATPESDLTGRQLGDYQILRRLGRGGMADVYLAEQQSLGRLVAFKVLKSSLASDDNYVRRFHHEAKSAASLVHANIVQIYEVGRVDGYHFIAQEYVTGQNLRQLLSRNGPLDEKMTVIILRQAAAALHKAGQQGVIHRDIKPENIMLSAEGEVKVADFGLARATQNETAMNLTQVGVTMGTPLYMSPEQVEGKEVDPRSDIYSLGVTFYQMLVGRPPFEGETAISIAVQHLNSEAPRIEDQRSDLPSGLCRVVHKMISKKPADRYQSAADLLRELAALQIEGLEEGWSSAIEQWSMPELLAISEAKFEATQQLEALMKTQALLQQRPRSHTRILAAAIACFLIGVGVAWATRPRSVLEAPERYLQEIEKQDNAEAQFWHAVNLDSERGWIAVWEYFPEYDNAANTKHVRKAKRFLAEKYLKDGRLDEALSLYKELSSVESTDVLTRGHGLIGQANVYAMRDENNEAMKVVPEIAALLRKLSPPLRSELMNQLQGGLLRNEVQSLLNGG